ncbi:hypothetical protein V2I01_40615 [Micromonospora sp. BRA006-A]|nr:hypothetical protein [Micromonospora sp. BRA006-A]
MTSARTLARYAERLHRAAGDTHHVASPLGAWLLLALTGPAATGDARAALAEALDADPDDAAAEAGHCSPRRTRWSPPPPRCGNAPRPPSWPRGGPPCRRTPNAVRCPTRRRWTPGPGAYRRADRPLPGRRRPDTLLILASALATRVSWADPFDTAPDTELGAGSAWSGRLSVLRTPPFGHRCWWRPPTGPVTWRCTRCRPAPATTARDARGVGCRRARGAGGRRWPPRRGWRAPPRSSRTPCRAAGRCSTCRWAGRRCGRCGRSRPARTRRTAGRNAPRRCCRAGRRAAGTT